MARPSFGFVGYVLKNTNQTTASIRIASPSDTASKAATDGPGSA